MLCHGTSCLTLFTHVTWTCLINLCKPGQAALAACMRSALATCPNVMNAPRVAAAAFCRLLLYALARNFVCYGNNLRQQMPKTQHDECCLLLRESVYLRLRGPALVACPCCQPVATLLPPCGHPFCQTVPPSKWCSMTHLYKHSPACSPIPSSSSPGLIER